MANARDWDSVKEANKRWQISKDVAYGINNYCPFFRESQNDCLSDKNPSFDQTQKSSDHIVPRFCKGIVDYKNCQFFRK